MRLLTTTFALLALAALPAVAQKKGLPWESDFDAALERAQREKRPVMIAMQWAKEKASLAMCETVYTDPEVAEGLRDFILIGTSPDQHEEIEVAGPDGGKRKVSKLFLTVDCDALVRNERKVKERYFDTPDVTVPQHIFLHPDGTVILKKSWQLDKKKLLDLARNALSIYTATATGTLESRMQAAMRQVQRGDEEERQAAIRMIVESGDERLIQLLFHTINDIKKDKDRAFCVRALGYSDLAAAGPILERWLSDGSRLVRNSAVVSLEETAYTKAKQKLRELFDKDKDDEVQKDCLRALGACGAGDAETKAFLASFIDHRDKVLRQNAYMALRYHVAWGEDELRKKLVEAYRKEGRTFATKAAIIYALGRARDPMLVPDLQALVEDEKNGQLREFAETAIAMLQGEGDGWNKSARKCLEALFEGDKIKRHEVDDLVGDSGRRGGRRGGGRGGR